MRIVALILLVSLVVTGCSGVRTYTYQKDRVDQRMEGNRGYILGTPPPAPVEREVPKRTIIGIDVEIPVLPGEEVFHEEEQAKPKKQEVSGTEITPKRTEEALDEKLTLIEESPEERIRREREEEAEWIK